MKQLLDSCTLCPRECHAKRSDGMQGYCRAGNDLLVARAALHMWEEPCISGSKGSGTVFFSGCAMGCLFCQNAEIALGQFGKAISPSRLADIFLKLQEQGAANINLVTAGHYIPQVIEALDISKKQGLFIPIVYNSSGYEKADTLHMLDGYVDIYLPDFKYMDSALSKKYSNAENYSYFAKEAIAEMVRQAPIPVFEEQGMMTKGVIVRHLILPAHTKDSMSILHYLHTTYGSQIYISIMNQYTPMPRMRNDPDLSRKVTAREYNRVMEFAFELGIENGFIQEGDTASESFIPDFHNIGV